MARKLAVIFYNMVKHQTEYDKNKLQVDTARQTVKKISYLHKEAIKYGFVLQNVAC